VQLHPAALEVLHGVRPAFDRLLEPLADRVSKALEALMLLPVGAEGRAEDMARFCEKSVLMYR
jgi:hypothetical protein